MTIQQAQEKARVEWGILVGAKSNQFDQEKALDKIIAQTLKDERERCIKIVYDENYELEEWYSSSEQQREIETFTANQKNMATRNRIINLINKE